MSKVVMRSNHFTEIGKLKDSMFSSLFDDKHTIFNSVEFISKSIEEFGISTSVKMMNSNWVGLSNASASNLILFLLKTKPSILLTFVINAIGFSLKLLLVNFSISKFPVCPKSPVLMLHFS